MNFFVDPVVKVSGSVLTEVLWCEIGRRLNEVLIPAISSHSVRLVQRWVHPCTWHNLMLWLFTYFSYAYIPKADTFWNTMPQNLHLLLSTTLLSGQLLKYWEAVKFTVAEPFSRVWNFSLKYKFYLQLRNSCCSLNDKLTSLIEKISPNNQVWLAQCVDWFLGNVPHSGPYFCAGASLLRDSHHS